MNIVIIYINYNQTSIDLSRFCEEGFIDLGHNATRVAYNHCRFSSRLPWIADLESRYADYRVTSEIKHHKPDLILIIKGHPVSDSLIGRIRKATNAPVANYWIDDPFRISLSKKLSPLYDYFFSNSPDCIPEHESVGCPHPRWLTFGASHLLHSKLELSANEIEKYGSDICFSGTLSEKRFHLLEALAEFDIKIWSPRYFTVFDYVNGDSVRPVPESSPIYDKFMDTRVWGPELVKVYNASKIALNIHDPQTCPIMRDFEVPGCGAMLLTDQAQMLETLFEIGKEIVTFDTVDDLQKKIVHYLENESERVAIANQGYERVGSEHMYRHRMNELINHVFTKN